MTINTFNAQELCSRKLWELVNLNPEQTQSINEAEMRQAIHELAERRHYLTELIDLDKLNR